MDADTPSQAPFPHERVPPDLLDWARQTFDEDEFLSELRQVRATGGVPLEAFIADIEARACGE